VVPHLDLNSGPGVLPLPAAPVGAVFRAQNLTWTVRDALRVLADVSPAEVSAPASVSSTWTGAWSGRSSPRRLPKLPPRKPAAVQLSLFD
jgi:hypothetical protein